MTNITATATTTTSASTTTTTYDLDSQVLNRYNGEARLQRLIWIGMHCNDDSNRSLQIAAYQAALEQCKKQNNVIRYKEMHHRISSCSILNNSNNKVLFEYDTTWVHETEQKNRQQREILHGRLLSAQSHLNKDSIRIAYTNLAIYLYTIGEIQEAYHTAMRAKDYCTTRHHTANNSLLILALAIFERNYTSVREYVPRMEHTVGVMLDTSNNSTSTLSLLMKQKVHTAAGLERMAAGDYFAAAEKFRSVIYTPTPTTESLSENKTENKDELIGETGSEAATTTTVLALEDVTLYAGILTLATGDHDMAIRLIEHPEALERVPIMKDILYQFHKRSNYKLAWELLDQHIWKPILQYDMYFQQQRNTSHHTISDAISTTTTYTHMAYIQQAIRYKAIGQFWKPYSNCPLTTMTDKLGTGIATNDLKHVVIQLLKQRRNNSNSSNNVFPNDTRLDLFTNTLVRNTIDPEQKQLQQTTNKLHQTSTRVLNDTYSMLVRIACLEQDLITGDGNNPMGGGKRGRGGGRQQHHHQQRSHTARIDGSIDDNASGGGGSSVEQGGDFDDEYGVDDGVIYEEDDAAMMIDAMNPEDRY